MKNHVTPYSGFRRITEDRPTERAEPCMSPEHNPPSHIALTPGKYEYTCPNCGQVTIVEIPLITC